MTTKLNLDVRTADGSEHSIIRRLSRAKVMTDAGTALPLRTITHVKVTHLVRTKKGYLTLRHVWSTVEHALKRDRKAARAT